MLMNELVKWLYELMGFKIYGIEKRVIKMNGVYSDDEYMVLFF